MKKPTRQTSRTGSSSTIRSTPGTSTPLVIASSPIAGTASSKKSSSGSISQPDRARRSISRIISPSSE